MSLTQYYTATSLDGFIADPDNSLDWLFTREREEDGPLNYDAFIADIGALGRPGRSVRRRRLLDEVIVSIAPVTLGGRAPLRPDPEPSPAAIVRRRGTWRPAESPSPGSHRRDPWCVASPVPRAGHHPSG